MTFGGLRIMWVMVMFDLPVVTKQDRKNYTRFRNKLLDSGFMGLQFSVYARACPSDENAQVHRSRIERHLPPYGQVRILMFTDKQFARMQVFHGKKPSNPEESPQQVMTF